MVDTLSLISILAAGYSLVTAAILLTCYIFFMQSQTKHALTVLSCSLFLFAVIGLQLFHLSYFSHRFEPLDTLGYRSLLFCAPPLFYFFCRFLLFADYQLKLRSIIHLFPFLLVWYLPRDIAVPLAFFIGTGYCFWMLHVIYGLKNQRKKFEIEFFFFAFFAVLAVAVLVFGFSATYIDSAYFYHFYTNGIALAFALVNAALIIYPDLLNELTQVVSQRYSKSTLGNVDVQKQLARLDELMQQSQLYQNENLNLAKLAEAMELSSHQLSELINSHYGMSFSQYLRDLRVTKAKQLLKNEPEASILSISMETGFKSQSNFYAAFKELTGMSPGAFRKDSQS